MVRGFIEQATDPEEMETLFTKKTLSAYIGFDPTAESLHVGSLIPIMALAHLQQHGHRPIALVGGGTALIGDPSGKKEMRPVLSHEEIRHNAEGLKKQLTRYMILDGPKGILLNNVDWLTPLNYIEFLRDIGRHFSVNRMLTAESVKQRLETGLSFIEFNYQLLQAYDFLHLYSHQDCLLQMGGSDQWGNIVAGIDLIRRMKGGKAYGLTFPLIVTSSGEKMGKTAQGAVWLDPEKTSPYEYYQFWINTEDQDVGRFLALFTFLTMDQVPRTRPETRGRVAGGQRGFGFGSHSHHPWPGRGRKGPTNFPQSFLRAGSGNRGLGLHADSKAKIGSGDRSLPDTGRSGCL